MVYAYRNFDTPQTLFKYDTSETLVKYLETYGESFLSIHLKKKKHFSLTYAYSKSR